MKKVVRKLWYVAAICIMALGAQALYAGTATSIEILSPRRGEDLPAGSVPVIAFSLFDLEGDTETSTVELEVDGTDVTPQANVSALLVTYTFEGAAAAGRHTFSFTVKDREGNEAKLDSYFSVSAEPKRDKKITANGSVRAGAEYVKEADQNLTGLIEANVYGRLSDSIDYSADVSLTNEEASDGQRVSSYRLDLRSPVGVAVLGDATPSFTSYSIDGTEVFGVHLLPQFGILGLELLYGQTLRKVDDPETFKQMVYGGKVKVGNPGKFQWGLAFLKVKDDKDSLTAPSTVTPKDNVVLGTDFSLSFLKGLVSVEAEANESLLNEDITDGASDFGDNKLPFDPKGWEWLFVINEHMVPITPGFSNLAARVAAKIGPIKDNTLNVEYSYIGPSYNSLANLAIVKDRAGIKAWDSAWLLRRKVFLNLAGQYYTNNLEDTSTDTTKTFGFSGSTYVYPVDLWTFNAGVDFQRANNGNDVDTTNTTINGGVAHDIELLSTNTNVYFNGSAALFKDGSPLGSDSDKYTTRLGAVSYFTGMPLDTKAVVGFDFGDIDTSVYLQGRAGYRFLKEETLYAFTDLVYETGPELLDWKVGADYETPWDVTFEADFEYVTAPGSSDVILSAYATKRF